MGDNSKTSTALEVKDRSRKPSRRAKGCVGVVVDELGIRSAAKLFDVGGASATKQEFNLDRHWRNIRTLASHNPTNYKARTIGDHYANNTELPNNGYF